MTPLESRIIGLCRRGSYSLSALALVLRMPKDELREIVDGLVSNGRLKVLSSGGLRAKTWRNQHE